MFSSVVSGQDNHDEEHGGSLYPDFSKELTTKDFFKYNSTYKQRNIKQKPKDLNFNLREGKFVLRYNYSAKMNHYLRLIGSQEYHIEPKVFKKELIHNENTYASRWNVFRKQFRKVETTCNISIYSCQYKKKCNCSAKIWKINDCRNQKKRFSYYEAKDTIYLKNHHSKTCLEYQKSLKSKGENAFFENGRIFYIKNIKVGIEKDGGIAGFFFHKYYSIVLEEDFETYRSGIPIHFTNFFKVRKTFEEILQEYQIWEKIVGYSNEKITVNKIPPLKDNLKSVQNLFDFIMEKKKILQSDGFKEFLTSGSMDDIDEILPKNQINKKKIDVQIIKKPIIFFSSVLHQKFANFERVKELNLSGKSISNYTISKLMKKLNDDCCLKHLILSKNTQVTAKGMMFLEDYSKLQSFDLSDNPNQFGTLGFYKVFEFLKKSTNLVSLNLSNTGISDPDMFSLSVVFLQNNHSLKTLNLSNNKIKDKGVYFLSEVINDQLLSLQFIDFQDNEITDVGANNLIQSINHSFNNKHLIEKEKKKKKNKMYLNLKGNHISSEVLKILDEFKRPQLSKEILEINNDSFKTLFKKNMDFIFVSKDEERNNLIHFILKYEMKDLLNYLVAHFKKKKKRSVLKKYFSILLLSKNQEGISPRDLIKKEKRGKFKWFQNSLSAFC